MEGGRKHMVFLEAKEIKLQALLSNAQETYKVPLYQRPYAWNKDQWEDLFEDIIGLSPNDVHFLGSIVVVPEGEHRLGVNYFQIVDGQQRLATILIWLSALRDIAKEKRDEELANHITETFLFAREWEGGKQKKVPKLQLGELNNDAFQRVLNARSRSYSDLIFVCYDFFKNKPVSEDIWQTILNNVSIVHINAFSHFNAFRLFETLNDRGLALSAADLIKNFLLMKISPREDIFNETINEWNEMYEKIRDIEPVKFIRRYFLATYKGKVSEARLYEEVRRKLEKAKEEDILSFTKNLNQSATIYKKIFEATFSDDNVNKTLKQLHIIEVAPSFTLLLKVMPFLVNELSRDDILQIIKMIEIFHIRWGVCGQSTSRLDQIYNDICIELSKKKPREFLKHIKERLTREIKKNVDDEIFKRNFISRSFKPTDPRTKYILWKLSEPTGETILNIKEVQTEHIMPQTLSEEWIDYLESKTGKNKEEIKALHQENLDRIGNLAIIKGEWNRSMSNSLFEVKQSDYVMSEFERTKELSEYIEWTFNKINEQSEKLAEIALSIWNWEE